jgi:hypothetical protein
MTVRILKFGETKKSQILQAVKAKWLRFYDVWKWVKMKRGACRDISSE